MKNANGLGDNCPEVPAGMAKRLQIRLEFNAVEDRLLLRISERESRTECFAYSFWLTRRFVNMFLTAIDKLIGDELAADLQVSPDAIDAMKKFQHEAALSKADFSTAYGAEDENCTVFRKKSILVARLKIKKRSAGKYVLSFLNNENIGIHLTVGMDIIHSLQKMLMDAARNAAWHKPLFQAAEEVPETTEPGGYLS